MMDAVGRARSGDRLVVIVAVDGTPLLNITGPADVFSAAQHVLDAGESITESPSPSTTPAYRVLIATKTGEPVTGASGVRIAADCALGDLADSTVDTLIVTGGPALGASSADGSFVGSIARTARMARRTCSVCTGAFALAAAGLLDGRRATTHWAASARLRERFPAVTVEPDQIYIREGPIATSGGVTAGIDLALALVEEDLGSRVALSVARWLVVFAQRPGNQAQFSERLTLLSTSNAPIRTVIDSIVGDPSGAHRVSDLAERASMSERHFTRVFVNETGMTPGRFTERVRVEAARELLERTSMPVETVARRCGFANRETLRRAFHRILDATPTEYRERFSARPVVSEPAVPKATRLPG